MEDQELKDKISEAHTEWATGKVGYSITLTDHLLPIIQSYAGARVEAETKELEDDYAELKTIHDKFYESDALQHKQILALKAEINQLRNVVKRTRQYCESGNGCGGATKLPSGEWHNEGEGTLYHAVLDALSSEPIEQIGKDETKKITLQMYECNSCLWYGQVGESIETESCDICPECKSEDLKLCDE